LVFVFALFFQEIQNQSAVAAGLRFVPWAATFVLVGPLVGRRIESVGARLPMTAGCLLLSIGSLVLLRVSSDSGFETTWWPFVIVGAGYGLLSTPMAAVVLSSVPPARAGMASSTNLTARLIGGVFGVAVLGALLPSGSTGPVEAAAFVKGLHTGLYVSAGVAAAGAALSAIFIRPDQRRVPL
jgi:hypothetical protein